MRTPIHVLKVDCRRMMALNIDTWSTLCDSIELSRMFGDPVVVPVGKPCICSTERNRVLSVSLGLSTLTQAPGVPGLQ